MNRVVDVLERLRVLAGTAVTYLVAAAVGLSAAADELAATGPDGGETAVAWLLRVVAWVGAAVAVVRRVTPVPSGERGLLPPGS